MLSNCLVNLQDKQSKRFVIAQHVQPEMSERMHAGNVLKSDNWEFYWDKITILEDVEPKRESKTNHNVS